MKVKEFKVGFAKTVSKNYNSQKIEVGMECELGEGENYGAEITKAFLYCKAKVLAFEQSLLHVVIEDEKPKVEPTTRICSPGFEDYKPEPKGVKNDLPNELVGVVVIEVRPKAIRVEANGRNTWLPIKSLVKGFEAHGDPQTIEVYDWMKEKIEWRDN